MTQNHDGPKEIAVLKSTYVPTGQVTLLGAFTDVERARTASLLLETALYATEPNHRVSLDVIRLDDDRLLAAPDGKAVWRVAYREEDRKPSSARLVDRGFTPAFLIQALLGLGSGIRNLRHVCANDEAEALREGERLGANDATD